MCSLVKELCKFNDSTVTEEAYRVHSMLGFELALTVSPALARIRLASWLIKWVTRMLIASMASCMAFTRIRKVVFSFCNMAFSWQRSLQPSEPSSPITRLPFEVGRKQRGRLKLTKKLFCESRSYRAKPYHILVLRYLFSYMLKQGAFHIYPFEQAIEIVDKIYFSICIFSF